MKKLADYSRSVVLQCPQCGAPVTLEEDDRILSCQFCRVRLILFYPGVPRYLLEPYPPSIIEEELYYAPYWRIRGLALPGLPYRGEERFVDFTCQAINLPFLPLDLGLQARAFKLGILSSQKKGILLKPEIDLKNLWPQLPGEKEIEEGPEILIARDLIAPSIGLVYAPFIIKKGLIFEGLGNRLLGNAEGFDPANSPTEEPDPGWLIKFKPTLCPYCGADLDGSKETLVFICRNCDRAWESHQEGLKRIAFRFMGTGGNGSFCWIPFWRITMENGEGINSVCFSTPRSSQDPERKSKETRESHLWFPAFRIAPSLFLTIIRAVNFRSPEVFPLKAEVPQGNCHPVTISGKQALEGMKFHGLSLLKPFNLQAGQFCCGSEDPLLVYLPFHLQGSEWVQEEISLGINKNALTFGQLL